MPLLVPYYVLITRLLFCYCNRELDRPMMPTKYPLFWYSYYTLHLSSWFWALVDPVDSHVVVLHIPKVSLLASWLTRLLLYILNHSLLFLDIVYISYVCLVCTQSFITTLRASTRFWVGSCILSSFEGCVCIYIYIYSLISSVSTLNTFFMLLSISSTP